MKQMPSRLLLVVAGCMLAACASLSQDAQYRAKADEQCLYSPNPEARARCMEATIELLKAQDAREAESIAEKQARADRMEEEALARGTTEEYARPATDSGLRLPD